MCDRQAPSSTEKTINFYKASAAYGFLSNFSWHSVTINGVQWPTVEHYFQGQKFAGTRGEDAIRLADTPGKAKKLGGNRQSPYGPLRTDWSKVKDDIMYNGLVAKFTQHPNLAKKLLETGSATLVEHTDNDTYWGDGGNGRGQNRLGVLLQRVRDHIRQNPHEIVAQESSTQLAEEEKAEESEKTEKTETSETNNDGTAVPKEDGADSTEGADGDDEDDDIEENSNRSEQPSQPQRTPNRRTKNKGRRNAWKDGAGRSLFEMDSSAPGQVSLVTDSTISIPMSALPSAAKYVVKKNQFSRRRDADEEGLEEDDAQDDYDDYTYSSHASKTSLGDFLGTTPPKAHEPVQEPQPEYLESPNKCLETAQANLELYHLLDISDPSRTQIVNNLSHVRNAIIHFISQSEYGEETMNQLLTQLSVVNEVVGEA